MFFCQTKMSSSSKNNPKIVDFFNYLKIQIIIVEAQIMWYSPILKHHYLCFICINFYFP